MHRTHSRPLEFETLIALPLSSPRKAGQKVINLALQERSRRSHHAQRSRRLRNPDQLRRRDRYRQTASGQLV
jgi:hypothetical protein